MNRFLIGVSQRSIKGFTVKSQINPSATFQDFAASTHPITGDLCPANEPLTISVRISGILKLATLLEPKYPINPSLKNEGLSSY